MSWLADLATVIGVTLALLATLWGFLRWISEPRLRRAIVEVITPVRARVDQLELRTKQLETHHERTTEAIERIGRDFREGMEKLATSIGDIADKQNQTAVDVGEIRGEIRGALTYP
ncbi:MAG: hypothetical protein H3C62_17560, partial [Gemmatimonadaceae bacterium]|nr:hypothetical protein [Gemmatimonadaceae bacterium]